jgi:acyl-CoA thioesterase-1
LLIVGDSLSSGYGLAAGQSWVDLLDARMKKAAPSWRVINASVSGDTTQNGLQRLAPALSRQRPQGVLIELGGNDALRGTPPAVIKQNLQAMIRQARASGAWVVLLDAPVLPNYGKLYADAVAKLYVDVAREEKIIRVPCFVCGVGITPGMMQADGIHPNETAQPHMLEAVWPHIQPKLRCPAKKP